jgi:hypothetical protein
VQTLSSFHGRPWAKQNVFYCPAPLPTKTHWKVLGSIETDLLGLCLIRRADGKIDHWRSGLAEVSGTLVGMFVIALDSPRS